MRKALFILCFVFIPFIITAQISIGSTIEELKAKFPNMSFDLKTSPSGILTAWSAYGENVLIYLFDKNKEVYKVHEIIKAENTAFLNAQVNAYNQKYVIVSDKSWKAYLPNGHIMTIALEYDKTVNKHIFTYSQSE